MAGMDKQKATRPTTVLLLDARWPSQVPLEWAGRLAGQVVFTAEVPTPVREVLAGFVGPGEGLIVASTNEQDPQVRDALVGRATLWEVPSRDDAAGKAVAVMVRALAIGEWEQQQTHESLIPYLREETEELAEAIKTRADEAELKKELSDLLLQVLFHAEIAARRGAFNFSDVCAAFVAKMQRRAPYLFDGTTTLVPADTQDALWQAAKRAE